jgi:hypothetical protein
MRTQLLAVAAVVLTGAGCLSTTTPDPALQTVAAVAGQVTRQDGSPVGGPLVSLQLTTAAVNGSANLLGQSSVIGDNDGRFLFVFLINGYPAQVGSASLSVTAPIASGLAGRDTVGIPVNIVQGDIPTDTAYVQIVLPAR